MEKRNILIGGAWPYANSSLHLGHIAGLISGDVLARYFRLKGDNVLYVSGSDTHGTPITERARKENKDPQEIAEYYDAEFRRMFDGLQFSYDLYSRTFEDYHKEKVQQLFRRLYDNGYITIDELKKTMPLEITTKAGWRTLVSEVDKDGDYQISFKEFKEMMEKLINQ